MMDIAGWPSRIRGRVLWGAGPWLLDPGRGPRAMRVLARANAWLERRIPVWLVAYLVGLGAGWIGRGMLP